MRINSRPPSRQPALPMVPDTPDFSLNGDIHATPDASLGGYFREHERPPAFEGADGEPYTVSVEAEKTPDLKAPWDGYLVFPRWASTGLGVVGHVETPTLVRARSREEVIQALGQLPLVHVKQLLDQALRRQREEGGGERRSDPPTEEGGSEEDGGGGSPDEPASS